MTIEQRSLVTFTGDSTFSSNVAVSGGAIYLSESELYLNGNILFFNNTAYMKQRANLAVCGSSARSSSGSGGAILSEFLATLLIDGSTCSFINNTAQSSGGAIDAATTHLRIQSLTLFYSNSAVDNNGGAIAVLGFMFDCYGTVHFVNNTAPEGGALYILVSEVTVNSESVEHNPESMHANVVVFHIRTQQLCLTVAQL